MAVKGWDNIYDYTMPSEMAKPGDVVLQPVEDSADLKFNFNRPDQTVNLPSEKPKHQNNRDPETETQFPSLSLDSERPNQPPRKAFFTDSVSEPVIDKDYIEDGTDKAIGDQFVSTHKKHQVPKIPDPYHHELIARSIVAEHNLENYPVEIDLENPNQTKVAWTLPDLVNATSRKSLKYESNCAAAFRKVRAKDYRWDMRVSCGEEWSDPAGHVVKFKFVPDNRVVKATKSTLLVSCSCEFWRYYGCDWNSLRKDYNERQMGNGAAPTIRGKTHLICKHVAACVPLIKNVLLKKKAK